MDKLLGGAALILLLAGLGCEPMTTADDDDSSDDDAGDDDHRGDGAIAFYPFDGNADDASGNGNHGTVAGPVLTEDRFGIEDSAYTFDGQDDGIQVAVPETFSVSELTLSAWIAIEGHGTWNPRIVGVGPEGTSHQHYVLAQEGEDHEIGLFFMSSEGQDDGEDEYWTDGTLESDQTWHHFLTTISEDEIALYVDGELDRTCVPLRPLPQFTEALLQIGHSDDSPPSDAFQGAIDDVRIYDRALSAEEVQALFEIGGWSAR